jgi:hypothetical protein
MFFDCEGVIRHEFLPHGHNGEQEILFEGDKKAERGSEEIKA